MREHDAREARLLHAREPRHVGVRQHVGGVLVILRMRDREPDLRKARRPLEHYPLGIVFAIAPWAERVVNT